jgi:hypothetical protein
MGVVSRYLVCDFEFMAATWLHATGTCVQGGYTALVWAAIKGHVDCLRLLLDAGANANAKDNVRIFGCVESVVVWNACFLS